MLGMVVKFCLVTGKPANKSYFYNTLKKLSPDAAEKMTIEVEIFPHDSST